MYDDGGLSGGTMERPALKRLLEDIEASKVQIVVVYKVDRLTRSLSDFAKIVDVLDAHNASFVSVTQQFNTTTSMGRLTLNMLLSFAQFEREIAGERIRDKIAASKKKGMWMGGNVPLGYDVKDRKLIEARHAARAGVARGHPHGPHPCRRCRVARSALPLPFRGRAKDHGCPLVGPAVSSASGGSWILTQGRGRAMAKADLARTGSTIRCAICTRKLASMGADAEPLAVSLMDLIGKRIQVICSTQNGREYLYEALDVAAKGKVKVMAETYLLADAPKAYKRVAEGKPRFRAVLTM
jgi:hypothetical protein